MKTTIFFSAVMVLLFLASCTSNKDGRKSFDDVVAYNDFIVRHINSLDSAYILALATEKGIDSCLENSDRLVQLCERTARELKGIQPYKGDSTLTMQALAYTQFMKNNGKLEIRKLLKLIETYQQATFEEQEKMADQVRLTAENIDKRYNIEINKVDRVQQEFSKKHQLKIAK